MAGKDDKAPAKVNVQLKRSHWIGEERHDAPEVIEVDFDTAMTLLSDGVAVRTDPLKKPE